MAEALYSDIAMLPGDTDVVRVNSTRWEAHADVTARLVEGITCFLPEHADLPIADLMNEFENNDPHISVGEQLAHVLYGPRKVFQDDDGKLKADIRGIVYKAACNPRSLHAQFGGAGRTRKTRRRGPPRARRAP